MVEEEEEALIPLVRRRKHKADPGRLKGSIGTKAGPIYFSSVAQCSPCSGWRNSKNLVSLCRNKNGSLRVESEGQMVHLLVL